MVLLLFQNFEVDVWLVFFIFTWNSKDFALFQSLEINGNNSTVYFHSILIILYTKICMEWETTVPNNYYRALHYVMLSTVTKTQAIIIIPIPANEFSKFQIFFFGNEFSSGLFDPDHVIIWSYDPCPKFGKKKNRLKNLVKSNIKFGWISGMMIFKLPV
jgi:hypothetical protein